mgnify:CR=1 FL=1
MAESRMDRIEKSMEEFFRGMAELRESQKKKTDEQIEKTSKKVEEVSKKLGELGITDGRVAEDLFYRNVKHLFGKREIGFTTVLRNLKKKGIAEYDIVAINKNKILVVEVKNKLDRRVVDKFITKRIPKFREIFPETGTMILSAESVRW